jgi:tetratricopeptide (TPR) repeat protein
MEISIDDFQNIVHDNGDPEMAFNLGKIFEEHNDYNSAITHYSNALLYDNTFSKAYFYRAQCFTKLKQFDNAIVDYNNFIQFISENNGKSISIVQYEIAKLHADKGDFKTAFKIVEKSLGNNPLNVQSLELRGTIYCQFGDIEHAISDYLEVEKLDINYFNNSPNLLMNLPVLKEDMALVKKILLTERSISLNPNNDTAFYNLGLYYKKSKQLVNAIEAYRKAHEISPLSLDNLRELCKCLVEHKDYVSLKIYLEKLVALGDETAKQNLKNLNDYFNS